MKLECNTGGPAFPRTAFDGGPEVAGDHRNKPQDGMTLRDYFAGKAMAGMLADSTNESSTGQLVFYAYKVADAMLEERAKP